MAIVHLVDSSLHCLLLGHWVDMLHAEESYKTHFHKRYNYYDLCAKFVN